jgi:hypothetical protein
VHSNPQLGSAFRILRRMGREDEMLFWTAAFGLPVAIARSIHCIRMLTRPSDC